MERPHTAFNNMTKSENIAISQLRKDEEIKILRADKGNSTVILNTKEYTSKLQAIITNDKYDELKKDPTKYIENKVYHTYTQKI